MGICCPCIFYEHSHQLLLRCKTRIFWQNCPSTIQREAHIWVSLHPAYVGATLWCYRGNGRLENISTWRKNWSKFTPRPLPACLPGPASLILSWPTPLHPSDLRPSWHYAKCKCVHFSQGDSTSRLHGIFHRERNTLLKGAERKSKPECSHGHASHLILDQLCRSRKEKRGAQTILQLSAAVCVPV